MAITERTLFIRTVKVKNVFKFYVLEWNGMGRVFQVSLGTGWNGTEFRGKIAEWDEMGWIWVKLYGMEWIGI